LAGRDLDDTVTQMAKRAVELESEASAALESKLGESISVEELSAKYLMMNADNRMVLFRELIASHGVQGIELARKVYNRAAELYEEVR
jgi:hypothetical protein